MEIVIECPFCKELHTVNVTRKGYIAWYNGELIQKAMPELSATEREALISGICPKCQTEIFVE